MQKKAFIIAFVLIGLAILIVANVLISGAKDPDDGYKVAVYVPGFVAGSPTYEMMVMGVRKAVSESESASVKVIEGDYNQGLWQEGVAGLAASGQFDLIVSSNPGMPEICAEISKQYPKQKFLLLDGYLEGNPNIYTFRYNQFQQGYLVGYFGAIISGSGMPGTTDGIKLGLIAAQEYPDMMLSIKPGFEKGAQDKASNAKVDFRVIGDWADAAKAAELADSMYDSGVDVILTIAGSASQGVIKSAKDRGKYVLWFDSNGYDQEPGVIIGCSGIAQIGVAYEKTKLAINGGLPFGSAEYEGIKEGRVYFIDDDPIFREYVKLEYIDEIKNAEKDIREGRVTVEGPVL